MSRYPRYVSKDSRRPATRRKQLFAFLVFLAFAIGGCGTDKENDPEEVAGTDNSAGTAGDTNAGNAGSAGSSSEPASGVDPDNPCSNPTIYTVDDLESLEECTSISGNLEVPAEATEIADLSGLTNISTVEGDLIIAGSNLKDIQGLSSLTSVGGKLIVSMPNLTTLQGLQNLQSVGSLYIDECLALTDLDGLGSLVAVEDDLSIYNKTSGVLTGLGGLSSLTSVGGTITLFNIQNVSTCEAYSLCDKLGIDKDDKSKTNICGTSVDDCGGSLELCITHT